MVPRARYDDAADGTPGGPEPPASVVYVPLSARPLQGMSAVLRLARPRGLEPKRERRPRAAAAGTRTSGGGGSGAGTEEEEEDPIVAARAAMSAGAAPKSTAAAAVSPTASAALEAPAAKISAGGITEEYQGEDDEYENGEEEEDDDDDGDGGDGDGDSEADDKVAAVDAWRGSAGVAKRLRGGFTAGQLRDLQGAAPLFALALSSCFAAASAAIDVKHNEALVTIPASLQPTELSRSNASVGPLDRTSIVEELRSVCLGASERARSLIHAYSCCLLLCNQVSRLLHSPRPPLTVPTLLSPSLALLSPSPPSSHLLSPPAPAVHPEPRPPLTSRRRPRRRRPAPPHTAYRRGTTACTPIGHERLPILVGGSTRRYQYAPDGLQLTTTP